MEPNSLVMIEALALHRRQPRCMVAEFGALGHVPKPPCPKLHGCVLEAEAKRGASGFGKAAQPARSSQAALYNGIL